LDGQVNYSTGEDGPERTASLVLSDPEGALSFGTSFAEDPSGTLWVNRLLRVKHQVTIPATGPYAAAAGTWTTVCMVGVPTAVARKGGEINLELGDKSLLADHGVRPRTYKRRTNVRK